MLVILLDVAVNDCPNLARSVVVRNIHCSIILSLSLHGGINILLVTTCIHGSSSSRRFTLLLVDLFLFISLGGLAASRWHDFFLFLSSCLRVTSAIAGSAILTRQGRRGGEWTIQ